MKKFLIVFAFIGLAMAPAAQAGKGDKAAEASKADFAVFAEDPAVAVATFMAAKEPAVFAGVDPETSDACTVDGDRVACELAFEEIIRAIQALIVAGYGADQNLGQFDPTTVAFSTEYTQSLLALNPIE